MSSVLRLLSVGLTADDLLNDSESSVHFRALKIPQEKTAPSRRKRDSFHLCVFVINPSAHFRRTTPPGCQAPPLLTPLTTRLKADSFLDKPYPVAPRAEASFSEV